MKILHFADAHIDMANYGRRDPESGLPLRVLDYLKSLDTIVETAIAEKVDLVIFAGDAYKDRSPAPTFQREWGRRIMRLSQASISTVLLVGNHDLSPSIGRAHAIQEFDTLAVPNVHVMDEPRLLTPAELGIPLYLIAIPWVSRSGLMASTGAGADGIFLEVEQLLSQLVTGWLEKVPAGEKVVMAAHASVSGASYGSERVVMLGNDLVLSGGLVKNPRLSYVALGHIHKAQNLNDNAQPPVVYPGSIERVDFGEAADDKFFVIAHLDETPTRVEWRKLDGIRPFHDAFVRLTERENVTATLTAALPSRKIKDAVVRLTVEYPRDFEPLIDEPALRAHAAGAFEFRLNKKPQIDARARISGDQPVGSLTPLELLDIYLRAAHIEGPDAEALKTIAGEILSEPETPSS